MLKLISITMFVCSFVWAMNFYGSISLNGLQAQTIFTAPTPGGIFFVNGQLSLPQTNTNGGGSPSQVIATVYKNGAVIYTGITGASGFQINQISMSTNDAVSASLTSAAAVDQGINAVRGQVYFGNTF